MFDFPFTLECWLESLARCSFPGTAIPVGFCLARGCAGLVQPHEWPPVGWWWKKFLVVFASLRMSCLSQLPSIMAPPRGLVGGRATALVRGGTPLQMGSANATRSRITCVCWLKSGFFSFRDGCGLLKDWLDHSQRSHPALLARSCLESRIMGASSVIHGPDLTVRDERAKLTEPGVRKAAAGGGWALLAGLSGERGRRALSS